ncbi:MFS transporter [Pseudoflavitalea sp. G-6-1-2]|uniref:MFS transporter n=1 Tax=Pseudoflavitalea sp. G-6-1-2 TaxID=2728841 RepID=UPI00146F0B2C|nr:MFS transporter [Pseudoflavitalea sp. G-6-1-2]NML21358.1 MFS transporter [Pseudoflavitalea sp. G-6-1-2]
MVEAPDVRTARKARIAIAVFYFLSGFGFATWASRIPGLQQQLHLNEAQLGAVLFAMPVGLMATLPLTGFLLRRFSSRNIMLIGAILFNGMMGTIGMVTETWQFAVLLFCFGSSRNLMNVSLNGQSIAVQALYSKSIIATFHGIWSVAGFTAAAVGALMVKWGVLPGWHFLVVGIALCALALTFFKDTVHQMPAAHERKQSFALPQKSMISYGLICFGAMACEGAMYDWSAIYLKKAVGTTKELATAGYAIYMVAMTTGRFLGDKIANAIGVKAMLRYSGLLLFGGLMLAAALPYPITAGIGFVMVGFGVSCVVPMVFSMAGKVKGMSGGPAIASVSTVGYFGFLMVPPVVGFVAEYAGLQWSFALMSLMGMLILWMVGKMKEQ